MKKVIVRLPKLLRLGNKCWLLLLKLWNVTQTWAGFHDFEHLEQRRPINYEATKRGEATYTVSHRECGQFRPYVHENFEKFKIISTPTGSWSWWGLRRDRIQLPVGVEIILNFSKFSWT